MRLDGLSVAGERGTRDLDLARLGDLLRFEGFSATAELAACELFFRAGDLSLREGLLLRGDPRPLAGDLESLRPIIEVKLTDEFSEAKTTTKKKT